MQRIGRLESQLASIAGPQKERFGREDFVDSPVPAQETRGTTLATATQTDQSTNGLQDDESDRLKRKVVTLTYDLALARDQVKVLKGHRRRRAHREQRVSWWMALSRRLGFSQPHREGSGFSD